MSQLTDFVEHVVDTMIPETRHTPELRAKAIEYLTVEVASLIQDSIYDKSISDEAEQIMAIEIAKEN